MTIFLVNSLRNSIVGLALILLPISASSQGIDSESAAVRRYAQTANPGVPSKAREKSASFMDTSQRKKGITEITASEEVNFEQSENKAVFVGDVVVRDPQFSLTCKKLTAYLRSSQSQEGEGGGGLERAIAEGDVVIVQDKVDADGKTTRYEGRGQKVVYETATDEVTLSGSPSVREGINIHIATDPSTTMKITSNKLITFGPSKTIIAPSKDD